MTETSQMMMVAAVLAKLKVAGIAQMAA